MLVVQFAVNTSLWSESEKAKFAERCKVLIIEAVARLVRALDLIGRWLGVDAFKRDQGLLSVKQKTGA